MKGDDGDMTSGILEKKEQAEADAEKLGGWDPRAAFISDTVRAIALLTHERLRLPPLFMPAIGTTHALSGCNHASLPVDGRLACLLVRDNDVSVRVFYRC